MKEKIEKVKAHLKEHKVAYIAGGVGVAAGVVVTLALKSDIKVTGIIIGKNNTLNQTTLLVRRGHPGNVIRCIQTGEVFASQGRAAEAMGISPSNLSQHLNGKYAHAGGYTFENLGEAK